MNDKLAKGHSLEHQRIVLISPDENLGNAAQRFNQQAPIALRHCCVLLQNAVQVLKVLQRESIFGASTPRATEPASTAKHCNRCEGRASMILNLDPMSTWNRSTQRWLLSCISNAVIPTNYLQSPQQPQYKRLSTTSLILGWEEIDTGNLVLLHSFTRFALKIYYVNSNKI